MDARADERGSQVRARLLSRCASSRTPFPTIPALDVAVSRALMRRVAQPASCRRRCASPARRPWWRSPSATRSPRATARRWRPRAAQGFGAVLRLAGGRAAVFHEDTLELAHAVPDPDPRAGIQERFETEAALMRRRPGRAGRGRPRGRGAGRVLPRALERQRGRRRKLAGIGQRVVAGGAHVGTVLVVDGAARVRAVLEPVYARARAGLGSGHRGRGGRRAARGQLGAGARRAAGGVRRAATSSRRPSSTQHTLALARELAAEHRPD